MHKHLALLKNQAGFGIIALILMVALLIAAVVYAVYRHQQVV